MFLPVKYQQLLAWFIMLVVTSEAVTIRHHRVHTCRGKIYKQCSRISALTCCGSPRALTSTRFVGLGDTYLGSVCTKKGKKDCGTTVKSSTGSSLCLSHQNIKGAFWFDCSSVVCKDTVSKRSETPTDSDSDSDFAKYVTSTVEPDIISFDGHHFSINYDVPRNVTNAFEELAEADASVDDIPNYLWEYFQGTFNDED